MPQQSHPSTIPSQAPEAAALRHPRLHRGLYYVGIFALGYFAFAAFFHVAAANQGLLLMLLIAATRYRIDLRGLAGDRMLQLSLAFLAYLAIRTLWTAAAFPDDAAEAWDAAKRWPITGFLGIVLVGYWLSRVKARPESVLVLVFAGFLARILSRLEWADLETQLGALLSGTARATFGYSAVNLGIWSGIALLGLVVFWRRLLPVDGRWSRRWPWLVLWLAGVGISAAALAFSQTRSAWLTVLLVLPPIALASLYTGLRSKKVFAVATLLLLGCGLLVVHQLAQTDLVQQRLEVDLGSVAEAASGEPTDLAAVGIGLRLAMYRLFWEQWLEHPVFGWGPGSMGRALDEGGGNALSVHHFEHFHSSYFSLLFQFGIVGTAFVVAMFVLLFRAVLRGHREGAMPADLTLFLIGSLLVLLLSALVNEPIYSSSGSNLVSLLGGIAYSYGYRQRLAPAPLGGVNGQAT